MAAPTPESADHRSAEIAALQSRLAAQEALALRWRRHYLVNRSFAQQLTWSLGWQLLWPLRAARRWLRPRGLDAGSLLPWQQVEPDPQAGTGAWVVTGPDACFLVPCALPAGRLRVRLRLTTDVPGPLALYADTGDGDDAGECLVQARTHGPVDREEVVRLRRPALALRLVPGNRPGRLFFHEFDVLPLSPVADMFRWTVGRAAALGRRIRSARRGFARPLCVAGGREVRWPPAPLPSACGAAVAAATPTNFKAVVRSLRGNGIFLKAEASVGGGGVAVHGLVVSTRPVAAVTAECEGKPLGAARLDPAASGVLGTLSRLVQPFCCRFRLVLDPNPFAAGGHRILVEAERTDGHKVGATVWLDLPLPPTTYADWLEKTRPAEGDLAWARRNFVHLPWQPSVSLLTAVNSGADLPALAATLRSLSAQAYPRWQLRIACDRSLYDRVCRQLLETLTGESRARAVVGRFPDVVAGWNRALEASSGELVGLIDPGDVLAPNALFEIVYHLNRYPDTDFVYTDEDASADGVRSRPVYKPGWTPDLLAEKNSVGRLWVARTDPLRQAGGFRGCDRTAEHATVLRLTETARRVGHVSAVLYTAARAANDPPRVPAPDDRGEPVVVRHAACDALGPEPPRRILVVKLDHLGDVLLSLPALERLRRAFPHADVTALVGSWAKPLMVGHPSVDRVLTYDFFDPVAPQLHRKLTPDVCAEVAAWLGPMRFDLAIDLRWHVHTREFLRLSGARRTAGFGNVDEFPWLTLALSYERTTPRQAPRRHVVQELTHLADAVAAAYRLPVYPRVESLPEEQAAADRLLDRVLPAGSGPLVGIHPGAGNAIKCWPPEHFARLAGRCVEELRARVVVFAGPGEADQAGQVVRRARHPQSVASLAGKLTVREFLAAVRRCDLFVGNDSGPTHLAASAGVPTLAVFSGAVHPAQWGPLGPAAAAVRRAVVCSPCYLSNRLDCPRSLACLRDLDPEQVWEAALRIFLPRWQSFPGPWGSFREATDQSGALRFHRQLPAAKGLP